MVLDIDVCQYHLGCALVPEQPRERLQPIRYMTRILSETERNYPKSERECLKIVWAVLVLRVYL